MDTLAAGQKAWAEISRASTFDRWKTIAVAVEIGRKDAIQQAGGFHGNRTYHRIFTAWLEANGFPGMQRTTRSTLCKLAENLPAIEKWRNSQPPERRAKLNDPYFVLRSWRKETGKTATTREHVEGTATDPWTAILDAVQAKWDTSDPYVIARAAYMAAKPFMTEPSNPRGKPARKIPAEQHATA